MPLLAYCIAEAGCTIEVPKRGVQGASLRTIIESGLICLLSEYHPSTASNHIRQTALEFNRVLQDLLRQVAIVPFRFPTLLADESEIRNFLQQHAAEYRDALLRLRDVVQIEINLALKDASQPQASGKQYLLARQTCHQKLADTAEQIREHVGERIREWRQHQSSTTTRCYMLVSRYDVENTLEQLAHFTIPSDLRARVTGPWPPTDFIALTPAEHENFLQSWRPPVRTKTDG